MITRETEFAKIFVGDRMIDLAHFYSVDHNENEEFFSFGYFDNNNIYCYGIAVYNRKDCYFNIKLPLYFLGEPDLVPIL